MCAGSSNNIYAISTSTAAHAAACADGDGALFSVAVMEALAVGRPMLVTYTSGLGELADRGLVRSIPLNSTTEHVAAAIVRNINEPLVPASVALPTWEGCAAELLALYRVVTRTAQHATA